MGHRGIFAITILALRTNVHHCFFQSLSKYFVEIGIFAALTLAASFSPPRIHFLSIRLCSTCGPDESGIDGNFISSLASAYIFPIHPVILNS